MVDSRAETITGDKIHGRQHQITFASLKSNEQIKVQKPVALPLAYRLGR